jgi:hypothetical protein
MGMLSVLIFWLSEPCTLWACWRPSKRHPPILQICRMTPRENNVPGVTVQMGTGESPPPT